MLIRKILIPLSGRYDPDDPEDFDVPSLQMGFHVAQRFNAHAEVLCVTGEPSAPDERWAAWVPGYGVRQVISWLEKESEARRRRARRAYEQILAAYDPPPATRHVPGPGFSTAFIEQVGEIGESVGKHGRLSDLIVLATSWTQWQMPFRPILDASLHRTACPLLVSPPKAPSSLASRIAIAWNDTVEAARAVSASLGLLSAAQGVFVICCKESETVSPVPDGLIDYLAWHEIRAEPIELAAPPRQAASAIAEAALAHGCDLVVAGAYCHTRARSLLFGSMTEYMLSEPKLPVLIVP